MSSEEAIAEAANALADILESDATELPFLQRYRDEKLGPYRRKIVRVCRARFRAQKKSLLSGLHAALDSLPALPVREADSEEEEKKEEDRKRRLRDLLFLLFWPRIHLVQISARDDAAYASAIGRALTVGEAAAPIALENSAVQTVSGNSADQPLGSIPQVNAEVSPEDATAAVTADKGSIDTAAGTAAGPGASGAVVAGSSPGESTSVSGSPAEDTSAAAGVASGESFIATYLKENGFTKLAGELDNTTTERLASVVAEAYESGKTFDQTVAEVKAKFTEFGTSRAKMIAQTELNNAFNSSILHFGEEAGATVKYWEVDTNPCVICIGNELASPIPIGDTFPSGHVAPTAHPRCECSLGIGA